MDTTTLNPEFLTKINACASAIKFVTRNKLTQFPISRLDEIEGDFDNYKLWLLGKITRSTFDDNGNQLTYKHSDGHSWTRTYEFYSGGQLKSVHRDDVQLIKIPLI